MTTALSNEERDRWVAAIDARYGTRLRHVNDVYVDRRGYVYAGSEYVATVGVTNDPADAREWATTLHAFVAPTSALVAHRAESV